MDILIGADGGGTKTALAAFDKSTGTLIGRTTVGGINYNFSSPASAAGEIIRGVRQLTPEGARVAAIGIGDPSTNDVTANPATDAFVSAIEATIGAPVFLRSDVYMALHGLTGGEPGVLIVSGTGCMAVMEDADGRIQVAGGWGRLTGDEGSGYYIALSAIKAVLRAEDGIAPHTALTEALKEYLGRPNLRAWIDDYYADPDAVDLAGFARRVDDCARAGDEIALTILKRAAGFLADYASALLKRSGGEVLGIYGSVLTGNAIVGGEFRRLIGKSFPGVSIQIPQISPEEAAAQLASHCLGKGRKSS